jgi:hypothetical protein
MTWLYKASLNGVSRRVSCTLNSLPHQQEHTFCMKLGGERMEKFHHGETIQRCFQNVGNGVKPALRVVIRFIPSVFFDTSPRGLRLWREPPSAVAVRRSAVAASIMAMRARASVRDRGCLPARRAWAPGRLHRAGSFWPRTNRRCAAKGQLLDDAQGGPRVLLVTATRTSSTTRGADCRRAEEATCNHGEREGQARARASCCRARTGRAAVGSGRERAAFAAAGRGPAGRDAMNEQIKEVEKKRETRQKFGELHRNAIVWWWTLS